MVDPSLGFRKKKLKKTRPIFSTCPSIVLRSNAVCFEARNEINRYLDWVQKQLPTGQSAAGTGTRQFVWRGIPCTVTDRRACACARRTYSILFAICLAWNVRNDRFRVCTGKKGREKYSKCIIWAHDSVSVAHCNGIRSETTWRKNERHSGYRNRTRKI